MKAVVAAENTEHTAGFSSHSDCVVLAPSCAFASWQNHRLPRIRIPIFNTRQASITGIVLQHTGSYCDNLKELDLRASNVASDIGQRQQAVLRYGHDMMQLGIWGYRSHAGILPKEGGQRCRLHVVQPWGFIWIHSQTGMLPWAQQVGHHILTNAYMIWNQSHGLSCLFTWIADWLKCCRTLAFASFLWCVSRKLFLEVCNPLI